MFMVAEPSTEWHRYPEILDLSGKGQGDKVNDEEEKNLIVNNCRHIRVD